MSASSQLVRCLFLLIIVFDSISGFVGQCEEKHKIEEYVFECRGNPAYRDPISCHGAYDATSQKYMCEWSDENEYFLAMDRKRSTKHGKSYEIIDLAPEHKGHKFNEGDIFWVWFSAAKATAPKASKWSKIAKSFSRKKFEELDYNKYCDFLLFTEGKLINAFYDERFMDMEVAAHLSEEPWFSLEIDTTKIVHHPLDTGAVAHISDVPIAQTISKKKKTHIVYKNIFIRKILDPESHIWFVVPDVTKPFSLHSVFFRNFEEWYDNEQFYDIDITLWNQEMIFNNIKVAEQKQLVEFYENPPKGIVWTGGKVGDAKDKTGREEWLDMFAANKGAEMSGPFDLLKQEQQRPEQIYAPQIYNDHWWFFAQQMNKHYTDDKLRNDNEWITKYKRSIAALLKEKSSKKYGMAFFNNILNQVMVPTEVAPKPYTWTDKGEVMGAFSKGTSIRGVNHYTTESDEVNLWIIRLEHGNNRNTAPELADALENKKGIFGGVDVILMEHDLGRLYKQLRGIKEDLHNMFKTAPDESALERIVTAPEWYNSKIIQNPLKSTKNPSSMDKNLPIFSAIKTGMSIVLCDSPATLVFPTLFAQNWKTYHMHKETFSEDKPIREIRDNDHLQWVYRGMWLTQRNHGMVNGINEAVRQYYSEFMRKTIKEQRAKAKRNYVMIIGDRHWSASIGAISMGYKMGMHPMLLHPELFFDAAIDANHACKYDSKPYSKEFVAIASSHSSATAHISYFEKYEDYADGYNGYNVYGEYDDGYNTYGPILYSRRPFFTLMLLDMFIIFVLVSMIGCVIVVCGVIFCHYNKLLCKEEKYDNLHVDNSAV